MYKKLFSSFRIVIIEQLILNIKDSSKLSLLIQLIKQFDFMKEEKIKRLPLNMIFSTLPDYGQTGTLMQKNLENRHGTRKK